MPSPFPGMDPFPEDPAGWPNFHFDLIAEIKGELNRRLRPKYYARAEERVYVAEPVEVITLIDDEIREMRIEVIDATLRQVITVIEVLSPANKVAGARGQQSFRCKREEVLWSSRHWVEIDLLRAGERLVARELALHSDYIVSVSRVDRRPQNELWPIRLPERLPVIPIPLREPDPDAELDLQELLSNAYDRSSYDLSPCTTINYRNGQISRRALARGLRRQPWASALRLINKMRQFIVVHGLTIDYSRGPVPPLSPDYASWADQLLRARGLR